MEQDTIIQIGVVAVSALLGYIALFVLVQVGKVRSDFIDRIASVRAEISAVRSELIDRINGTGGA